MAGECAAKVKLLPTNRIFVAANAGAVLRHNAAAAQMSFFKKPSQELSFVEAPENAVYG
jgi:hypothetical protein